MMGVVLVMLVQLERAGERWREGTDEDASSNEFSTMKLNDFRHDSVGISGCQKGKGSE